MISKDAEHAGLSVQQPLLRVSLISQDTMRSSKNILYSSLSIVMMTITHVEVAGCMKVLNTSVNKES